MVTEFIKRIDNEKGGLVFTFTRIYTVNGTIFLTSVTGSHSQHFFRMEKQYGTWNIVKAVHFPDWIVKYEEELGKFIEEKLKEAS